MSSMEFGPASNADTGQPSADATPQQQAHAAPRAESGSLSHDSIAPGSAYSAPASPAPSPTRKVGNYVIESDVPMPDFQNQQARGRYPFAQLKVGESVVIQGVEEKTLDGARRSWLLRRGIDLRKVRVEGGFRVFRVA